MKALRLVPCFAVAMQVEKNVTVVSKALIKAGRFFEANGLDGCSKIASCVREQVNTKEPWPIFIWTNVITIMYGDCGAHHHVNVEEHSSYHRLADMRHCDHAGYTI